MLGVVSSALPIGGLPSFLLIGTGWWAAEKGARRLIRLFSDDLPADPPSSSLIDGRKKKKNNNNSKKGRNNLRKHKAKL